MLFRVLAVLSPGTSDSKPLLIYWTVYSSLTCVEYFGHSLFNGVFIVIEFLVHSLFHLSLFYWLGKCIFLIWFMKFGSEKISRIFSQDSDEVNDLEEGE
jgi:hypothetical protein